jgi:DNA-binding PadR family transcriptional regulator
MASEYLGELEQMILLAVLRLGPEAYGWAVAEELDRVVGRKMSSGALYTTLERLERKGLLAGRVEDPRPERGGRPRRYLKVTPEGLLGLEAGREAMLALWDGIEGRLGGVR